MSVLCPKPGALFLFFVPSRGRLTLAAIERRTFDFAGMVNAYAY